MQLSAYTTILVGLLLHTSRCHCRMIESTRAREIIMIYAKIWFDSSAYEIQGCNSSSLNYTQYLLICRVSRCALTSDAPTVLTHTTVSQCSHSYPTEFRLTAKQLGTLIFIVFSTHLLILLAVFTQITYSP